MAEAMVRRLVPDNGLKLFVVKPFNESVGDQHLRRRSGDAHRKQLSRRKNYELEVPAVLVAA